MPGFEKKFNKALIGLIIGTTIAGVAGARTPAGKKIVNKTKTGIVATTNKIVGFFKSGIKEMKKNMDEKEEDDKEEYN